MTTFSDVLRETADLLLPGSCPGCDDVGPATVPACRRCLSWLSGPVRRVRPRPCPRALPPVSAIAPYAGPVAALLIAYKDHGRLGLARPLGAALAVAVSALVHAAGRPGAECWLVPVPSSRANRRSRGFDHVGRLATVAARSLRRSGCSCRVVAPIEHRPRVLDQAGLGAHERAANLTGAFVVRTSRVPRPTTGRDVSIVLVDDIVTTGSTLAEAARALAVAGMPPHGAATVAVTERWSPSVRAGHDAGMDRWLPGHGAGG